MDDDNVTVEEEEKGEKEDEPTVEELQTKLKETEEALAKEKDKDKNFAKVRNKAAAKEHEAAEKEKEVEEKKKTVEEKFEDLEKKQQKWIEDQFQSAVDKRLDQLAGDDKELREKIMFNYENRLLDEANTSDQAIKKLDDAFLLTTGNRAEPNLISMASGLSTGGYQKQKKKDFSESEGGKSFLNLVDGNVDWDK